MNNRMIVGAIVDLTKAAKGDRDKARLQLQSLCFVAAWAGLVKVEDRQRIFEIWKKYGKYELPASERHTILRCLKEQIEDGQALRLTGRPLLPTG